jgi:1-acyl-sn-glycerol-3-phosphate acyltransferase
MAILRGGLVICFIVLNTIACCIPIYLLAIPRSLFPVDPLRVALGAAMTRFIDLWVAGNRCMLRGLDLARVETHWQTTAPLQPDHWYVIISNHQSWADILVLQDIFLGRVPPLKFFVKRQLVWVPLVGFAMWLLEFPYVRRYSREQLADNPELRQHDQKATQQACEHFKSRPTSVLNFMEGTRFTTLKHQRQGSAFRNLLMPKTGGFGYVVSSLADRIDQILDVTIVYPDGVPSFLEFLSGRGRRVRVEVSTVGVPKAVLGRHELTTAARQQLRNWVDELWARKDERIDQLRALH